ncbi:hypothetical protein JAAARDRAFT_652144 [Jaapia argillacea MUCL 33604]|uniref:Lytic polysaccharide monooxygenase n=1 Tax=Jaapia argillacea MUCL 33604 TaxID=933084 RepID=A0A067Q6I8_9AGAM|nr:hypothetical protein JAAARDRAFT_652144 [Jaapia argillacea MUCL 33604]
MKDIYFLIIFGTLGSLFSSVAGHASIFDPSMFGFNVTEQTFPYDNRPVAPLTNYTFEQWWMHGHLAHPPNPGDVKQLPAGNPATFEIACTKSATTFFNSSDGGNIQSPNDLKGCGLAIAYNNDPTAVQPEDFAIFSVNQTCVFNRFTDFQVPKRMPACPEGGCTCAWFWIHSPDSGGEQNYMTGFRCNVTGATSNVPVAKSQVPRRCGADPDNGKMQASPGNCTYGSKTPFYWFQAERNNMFEGTYSPPFYTDLYAFFDGSQDDIFQDSYLSIPPPSPNASLPIVNPNAGIQNVPGSSATTSSAGASEVSSTTSPSAGVTTTVVATSTVFVTVSAQTGAAAIASPSSSSPSAQPPAASLSFTNIILNTPLPSSASSSVATATPSLALLDVLQPTSSGGSPRSTSSPVSNSKQCRVLPTSSGGPGSALRRRSVVGSILDHGLKKRKLRSRASLWHIF